MPRMNIKPAFQAEYVNGKFTRTVVDIIEDVKIVNGANGERRIITRKMQPRTEEFTGGYMVYFPQGHSLFVAEDDREQLMRIGVLDDPRLVDMETGEEIPDDYNLSPKEIVARRVHNRPRAPGQTGAVEQEG